MGEKDPLGRFDPPAHPFLAEAPGSLITARILLFLTSALAFSAWPELLRRGEFSGRALGSYSAQWVILLAITGLLALLNLFLFVFSLFPSGARLLQRISTAVRHLVRRRWLMGIGITAPWFVYVLLVLYRYQKHFADFLPQVWLFFLAVGVGALFLNAVWKRGAFFWALLFTALMYGAGVRALGFLPDISAYPFSLAWSEGSRYYYASLPFARWLYGTEIPLSFLHPSRYFLQGLAFLVPGAGIEFHRLWQVALWLVFSLLVGLAMARRLRFDRPALTIAVAAWVALFLLQGPVYYHLLACVLLVLWGFERSGFWKTLVFVVLASIWAGISRVNWIPVPAMLAIALYLMKTPVCAFQRVPAVPGEKFRLWLRYLWRPAAWSAAGLAAALAAQGAYVLVSGHEDASAFGSSFTSALLWYRLMPNPTYPDGVIPSILLVSAPLLALLSGTWLRARRDWHPLRVLGITAMLLVLFAGGLVVSTKIGGGSNLHNLDAFLALLMTAGVVVASGGHASERGGVPVVWRPWPLLMAAVLLPVVWNINVGDPFVKHDFNQAAYDLDKLNGYVQKYAADGPVLMITQRQLVVFDLLPDVPMTADYELMTLTEMAMANNTEYLSRFYEDLENHRFALIVADRQLRGLRNPAQHAFAEENNAWVTNVSKHILEYYQQELFFDTQGIQLLVPKDVTAQD